jgi:hypothetical protein
MQLFGTQISRKVSAATAVLAIAVTMLVGSSVMHAPPAHAAAAYGAGGSWNAFVPGYGWLGNYIADDGKRVYCIDPLVETMASGHSATSALVTETGTGPGQSSHPASGDDLRRMNYAVTVHGQTSNDITAAAVAAYVFNFVSVNNRGRGENFIGGPFSASVRAEYDRIKADTEANFRRTAGSGSGRLSLTTDPENHYLGTLNVSGMSPEHATGSITLTNAVFADSGLATRDGVTNNSSFPIRAVPPVGTNEYRVSAEGAFHARGPMVYQSNVTMYSDNPGQQRSVAGGVRSASTVSFAVSVRDHAPRSTLFFPVVGTQVAAKYVGEGEALSDVLTFGVKANDQGLSNPWYQHSDGSYAPISARATIFGPFLAQPVESGEVPENAPVAATDIFITTSADEGPNETYTVDSGYSPEEPGFYTWVWEIDGAAQEPETRTHLAAGYLFRDRFGQVAETSVRPSNLALTTEVTALEAPLGGEVADAVTVSVHDGGWVQADGKRVPATLTGTAYFSDSPPELADHAPDDAQVLAQLTLVAEGPGTVVSEVLTLPITPGYVTFQWCLKEDDQPELYRGMLAETCDMYGQASETVQVVAPQITTQATPVATVHDDIIDTAIVTGTVPERAALRFDLFKKPVAGEAKWNEGAPTGEVWDELEVLGFGDQPVCFSENRVTRTDVMPLPPGNFDAEPYDSPAVKVAGLGTYWWVEQLILMDLEGGSEIVVHTGECGLPNETTEISGPVVATQAVESVRVGELAFDTALVDGVLPSTASGVTAELTFQVFRHEGGPLRCDASTLVHDLSEPIAVPRVGSYESPKVSFFESGIYFWVETLHYLLADGSRETVHVGECGLPNETTNVTEAPMLAVTGGALEPRTLLTVAGLLLGGGALAVALQFERRRRGNRT